MQEALCRRRISEAFGLSGQTHPRKMGGEGLRPSIARQQAFSHAVSSSVLSSVLSDGVGHGVDQCAVRSMGHGFRHGAAFRGLLQPAQGDLTHAYMREHHFVVQHNAVDQFKL